ncbi:MAG: hypothetical protein CHACPFDD_02450 [Phycisphaerae bacterium]|nr:hypothetical protein [Phycisphaerae bacterium]
MSVPRDEFDRRLAAYLDGSLDPPGRAELEQRAADEPALRREIGLQAEIDESLRRRFAGPSVSADELLERARRAAPAAAQRVMTLRLRTYALTGLAAAAVIFLSLGGGAWIAAALRGSTPASEPWQPPYRTMATVYADEVRAGFKPKWVCKNETQFAAAYWRRFNTPLTLAAAPAGVKPLGLANSNTLSVKTLYMLFEVEGKPVVVFTDQASADTGPRPEPPEGLHLFSRALDGLVLYELTPLDGPRAMELFQIASYSESELQAAGTPW